MNTETLKTYIEERREAMISDLRGLVEIPSVTENREQVKRALSYVLDLGREMGFTVETAAAGSVGVISFGEGDEIYR